VRTTHLVGVLVVALSAAGLIGFNWWQAQHKNVGVAQAWDIQGPPCPSLSQADFEARGFRAPKTFDYDGILIGRNAGAVSCADVKQGGGKGLFIDRVCQFTSAAAITVKTPKGAGFYFTPGVGKGATIVIHDGAPRCVMASKFTLQDG
jgi:hypothetical protein